MNNSIVFSQGCIDLITKEEGVVLHPYLDSVGVPTIGIGSTHYCSGVEVTMKDSPITLAQAQQMLLCYLNQVALPCLHKNVRANINQNQANALGDFIYNEGCQAFTTSHLLRYINIEAIPEVIKSAWLEWDMANHKPNADLLARRNHEIDLFYS